MKKRTLLLSSSSSSISSTSSCIVSPIKKKPNKRVSALRAANAALADNSVTSPKSRSSVYRGVTRHRWTGRYEAHLWDKATWNSIQNKRGRQVYLGAYDNEDDAAQTYDLAALKYWGPTAVLNFAVDTYTDEIEKMSKMSKEEYLASLRRRSNGFSRGVSKYRGVARHHQNGRWEARIGRVSGNKYLYLGTYDTQEEAAAAYDMAAIEFRGASAVTNFDISNYADKLKKVIPEVEVKPVEAEVKPVEVEVKPVEVEVKKEKTTPTSSKGKKVIEMPNQPDQKKPAQPVQPTIPKIEPVGPVDSQPMVVMDPTEEHDHPWNLCMDADFNSLPIPDFPMENTMDFLGLFDDKCFDDDISFIFDGPLCDTSLPEDAMSGNGGCENGIEQDVKGANVVTSPSLSLSTITSVCSNV